MIVLSASDARLLVGLAKAAAAGESVRGERPKPPKPPEPPKPVVYLAGRNDPCPCKSGKKYKRCCRP